MNCKIHTYYLASFSPPSNGLLHITYAAMHRRDTLRRSSPHPSTISFSNMPGNDQSFDVDAYLRYIFGEENEREQFGEQELHRPV